MPRDFKPRQIVVIGDTPRDVKCGREYGARTVAVATGGYSVQQLRRHKPDLVYKDFSDTERVIREIRGLVSLPKRA